MPKLRAKRILKLLLVTAVLTVGTIFAIAYHQGKRLASPDRRLLQDYHTEYFDHPHQHGIRIDQLICLDGRAPCLIVSPDPSAQLGKRGALIRQQINSPLVQHGQIIGNVVLLHGRNGRKEDLLPVAERFCAIGLRCLIPDLPAHGESPVPASQFGFDDWEKQLPKNILAECAARSKFDQQPCALWGMSMGGSFATSAASSDDAPWTSLTVVSSFDRLDRVINSQCRSATLAKLVSSISQHHGGPRLRDVRPDLWASDAALPVFVAHGSGDDLIDITAGRKLFASFPCADKRWVEVDGGTHSNVLTTPMPLYSMMADWILKHLIADQTAE